MSASTPARLCRRGAAHPEPLRPGPPADARHRDPLPPGEVLAGERARRPLDRAGVHHLAAVLAGAGPELEHEVGLRDGGEVVLDHDHRVAAVAQPAQEGEQPVGVARVQADRRLVEHVERVDQPRAERVGERDALRFAAGEGAGLAVEREIAEADVAEEAEPGVELVEDELRRPARSNGLSSSPRSQACTASTERAGDARRWWRRRCGPRARPG